MHIFVKQPFLIADIGFNFYDVAKKEGISELDAAKLMILKAKKCGVDGVNFHAFDAESLIAYDSSDYGDLSKEFMESKFNLLKKYSKFGKKDYSILSEYCSEIGIEFLVTPFDYSSVDCLDDLVNVFIMSSFDLTNIPFIKYVASKNKPVIISTGASTLREIKDAVRAIEEVSTSDIGIMHSVLSFPTALEDANLLMIKDLADNFKDHDIGYSDHVKPDENMFILTTAYNYGAIILKKHFTLDKTLDGEGHIHSMDSNDVIKFKRNIGFLSKINGYKNKQPLICESLTKKEDRRSIIANRDISKGNIIEESDIIFKKPGTGISPADIDEVVGKIASVNIKKDSLIKYEMLS